MAARLSERSLTDQLVNYSAGGSPISAKVWAVQPTCGGGGSVGGWSIFIDIYVNGSWEGWVSYGHLDQVSVSPGQVLANNTVLGKLKWWPYSSCYQVSTASGVHTHMEMYDSTHFACYINYNSGQYLTYPSGLGFIGKTVYTSVQSPC